MLLIMNKIQATTSTGSGKIKFTINEYSQT